MEITNFAEEIAPLPPDNDKWKKLKEENDELKEQLRKFQEKDNRYCTIRLLRKVFLIFNNAEQQSNVKGDGNYGV
jgi:hypothetical protein